MKTRIKITFMMMAFVLTSTFFMPVYGSAGQTSGQPQSMIVNASWLDYEMLRIDVADIITGITSSLAIRLSDFITDADNSRYIMIQATDLDGNLSGVIQIENPLYVPTGSTGVGGIQISTSPQGGLTPDGTGTVVDNVITQNELEFFTVFTEAGNVFCLVIDRQSSTDNVYLLNAVTEADLMALAESSGNPIDSSNANNGGNNSTSGIPAPPSTGTSTEPPEEVQNQQPPQPEPNPPEAESVPPSSSRGGGNFILIAVVTIIAGGAAYYFKIVRGRQASSDSDDENEDWDFGDEEHLDEDVHVEDTDERGDGE